MKGNVQGVVMSVRLHAQNPVQAPVIKVVKELVIELVTVHVKDCVLSVVQVVLILQNKMKKFIVLYLCVLACINMAGQEDLYWKTDSEIL